jgi:hypothetical protein
LFVCHDDGAGYIFALCPEKAATIRVPPHAPNGFARIACLKDGAERSDDRRGTNGSAA